MRAGTLTSLRSGSLLRSEEVPRRRTKAEYIAAALAACEIKFIQTLLEEILEVELRWHYLIRLYERKELTLHFVRAAENESDMMTKNTSEKLFSTKFAERVLDGSLQIREQWDRIVWEYYNLELRPEVKLYLRERVVCSEDKRLRLDFTNRVGR
jgi:hypothetical protein